MEEVTTIFDWYIENHTRTEIFWTVWNFLGSMAIVFLAYHRLIEVNNTKELFHNKWEHILVKAYLIMITIGALHHAFNLKPPSFWEGLVYSGILLKLSLRRVKQIRDKKVS